jgi:hypothetical protein
MKLKKLLNENLWNERKFGQSLPTLEDTAKAYKLKQEQEINEEPIVENNSSLKTKMIKHIQGMVKYSDRLGSDEIDDLKELLRLIQKIK